MATATAEEKKIDAVSTKILALGRDALMYIEKIKKLHRQVILTCVRVPELEYNAARMLTEHFERIKREGEALGVSIGLLRQGKASADRCLEHINQIRKSVEKIIFVSGVMKDALTKMEAGVSQELKDANYAKTNVTAVEAIEWELAKDVSPEAKSAVRRLISITRFTERKGNRMADDIKEVLDKIKGTLKLINTTILPNMTAPNVQQLRQVTTKQHPVVEYCEQNYQMDALAHFFQPFAEKPKLLQQPVLKNAVKNAAGNYLFLVKKLDSIMREISNLEAREGTLVDRLRQEIEKIEKEGLVKAA